MNRINIKKNGFTLIELLAVIVILAIIALISTPIIINVIEKARKGAFEDSAYGVLEAGKLYYTESLADLNSFGGETFYFGNKDNNRLTFSGKKPDGGTLSIDMDGREAIALFDIDKKWCAKKAYDDEKITIEKYTEKNCITSDSTKMIYTFSYTGSPSTFKVPETGTYRIELWGSSGQNQWKGIAGKGAYTQGTIVLNQNETLYIYVGNVVGPAYDAKGTGRQFQVLYNSGATDVRLSGGNVTDFESLKSRIMVAAAGGGAERTRGGSGGTLMGKDGSGVYGGRTQLASNGMGATQISGGRKGAGVSEITIDGFLYSFDHGTNGSFGIGGKGNDGTPSIDISAYGGGGYYGGGGISYAGGAGGGSSFISGHPGCDAIASTSTVNAIVHTGLPNHYSGKVFTSTVMIDGDSKMPDPTGTSTIIGNTGNGFAKITKVEG